MLALFGVACALGMVYLSLLVGGWIVKLVAKDTKESSRSYLAWSIVVGTVVVILVNMVPFIGGVVCFIGWIFALGAFVRVIKPMLFKNHWKKPAQTPPSLENHDN